MLEVWKAVVGYEGYYEVSNLGRIRSKNTVRVQGTTKHGYKRVNLSRKGNASTIRVHRAVAQAFIPNPEGKKEVNHIDGDGIVSILISGCYILMMLLAAHLAGVQS